MKDSIKITVIDRHDQESVVEAPLDMGFNVMEILRSAEYDVEGTCGGMALCASCHCYIESSHDLSDPSEAEEDMLDQAFFVEDNSRLTCQLPISESIDELRVRLAPVSE
ncbi:UNVERIFIED_CONTAM: hypothetical protein GTU68_047891 [Idotea baltica]|nr:hypothetical protein [Idotea baltica]